LKFKYQRALRTQDTAPDLDGREGDDQQEHEVCGPRQQARCHEDPSYDRQRKVERERHPRCHRLIVNPSDRPADGSTINVTKLHRCGPAARPNRDLEALCSYNRYGRTVRGIVSVHYGTFYIYRARVKVYYATLG
jgi:hypothetical protein